MSDLGRGYINTEEGSPIRQLLQRVNMNALTVLCLAAGVVCSNSQLFGYPTTYNYPGVLGAYPSFYHHAPAPVTFKTVAPSPVTLKTFAPAPFAFKTVSPTPVTYNYNVAPVAPVAPVQSKYHAQDELGQYSFGYFGGPSSRAETRDAFGHVRGSYNYVDPDGKVQTQHYVADGLGFRVAGTNLPVAPDASETVETPEVAAQKATLKAVHDETPAYRKKRSAPVAPPAPTFYNPYNPLRFSYGFSAPLTYTHGSVVPNHLTYSAGIPAFTPYNTFPAVSQYTAAVPGILPYSHGYPAITTYTAANPAAPRNAEVLQVTHNPGHAISYRVQEA
ncbi:hypothetical protein Pmani_021335 [Petrolisthes manimaculis]|uniref:Cuticle protein 6 n=1 Tax=Petrolisthes manimaculis TaxID=1843537 RepID=A0AAE1PGH1_9EUCA|nr:hypothetical protein Pmani_021335 [Petrolisthes manimaculis]